MFQRILLPLDLTEKHQSAIAVAAELAGRSKGEVTLLHIVELIPGLPLEEEKPFYVRLERLARAHLERLGGSLAERGIAWRAEVLFGMRAPEIARFAADRATDLILLTAPRIDPNNPVASLGSVSYKVSILAPCPVLLVK